MSKLIENKEKMKDLSDNFDILSEDFSDAMERIEKDIRETIDPSYYESPDMEFDLIEMWYRMFPLDVFRGIVFSHVTKYMFRNKDNMLVDFMKAREFIDRMIGYLEELEKK